MDEEERFSYIDVLRVVSILAVVLIHATVSTVQKFSSTDISWWFIGNIYESLSRWSIPIMVMVSGMLLLDPRKEDKIGMFFKKRFNKVVIPLIFWSIIYIIWKYKIDIIEYKPLPILIIIKSFITGSVYYHLWFIYLIIGLYIATPFLRVYVKNATFVNIKYFLIIWFISNGIIIFTAKITHIMFLLDLNFFTGYVGYFILGYYLHNVKLEKRATMLLYFFGIIGFMITFLGTYILTKESGKLDNNFYGYLAPNVIMMSICIFILIKNISWRTILNHRPGLNNFILEVSSLSFGIYFIHVIILQSLSLPGETTIYSPIVSIPIKVMMTLLISCFLIKLMKILPIIKKAVP